MRNRLFCIQKCFGRLSVDPGSQICVKTAEWAFQLGKGLDSEIFVSL